MGRSLSIHLPQSETNIDSGAKAHPQRQRGGLRTSSGMLVARRRRLRSGRGGSCIPYLAIWGLLLIFASQQSCRHVLAQTPSFAPTATPIANSTPDPSSNPTNSPTNPTNDPTSSPTNPITSTPPTQTPTDPPTSTPTITTLSPSLYPTLAPSDEPRLLFCYGFLALQKVSRPCLSKFAYIKGGVNYGMFETAEACIPFNTTTSTGESVIPHDGDPLNPGSWCPVAPDSENAETYAQYSDQSINRNVWGECTCSPAPLTGTPAPTNFPSLSPTKVPTLAPTSAAPTSAPTRALRSNSCQQYLPGEVEAEVYSYYAIVDMLLNYTGTVFGDDLQFESVLGTSNCLQSFDVDNVTYTDTCAPLELLSEEAAEISARQGESLTEWQTSWCFTSLDYTGRTASKVAPCLCEDPPTLSPSFTPKTGSPSITPTSSPNTLEPSQAPTPSPRVNSRQFVMRVRPEFLPGKPTRVPVGRPSSIDTLVPTPLPSRVPSTLPSVTPSLTPTSTPTLPITHAPAFIGSPSPTIDNITKPESSSPTSMPTDLPTSMPTMLPTVDSNSTDTGDGGRNDTRPDAVNDTDPTFEPSSVPTNDPTRPPISTRRLQVTTEEPTLMPTFTPTFTPTYTPTYNPTASPSEAPTVSPTDVPSDSATLTPSGHPSTSSASPSLTPTLFQPLDNLIDAMTCQLQKDLLNTVTALIFNYDLTIEFENNYSLRVGIERDSVNGTDLCFDRFTEARAGLIVLNDTETEPCGLRVTAVMVAKSSSPTMMPSRFPSTKVPSLSPEPSLAPVAGISTSMSPLNDTPSIPLSSVDENEEEQDVNNRGLLADANEVVTSVWRWLEGDVGVLGDDNATVVDNSTIAPAISQTLTPTTATLVPSVTPSAALTNAPGISTRVPSDVPTSTPPSTQAPSAPSRVPSATPVLTLSQIQNYLNQALNIVLQPSAPVLQESIYALYSQYRLVSDGWSLAEVNRIVPAAEDENKTDDDAARRRLQTMEDMTTLVEIGLNQVPGEAINRLVCPYNIISRTYAPTMLPSQAPSEHPSYEPTTRAPAGSPVAIGEMDDPTQSPTRTRKPSISPSPRVPGTPSGAPSPDLPTQMPTASPFTFEAAGGGGGAELWSVWLGGAFGMLLIVLLCLLLGFCFARRLNAANISAHEDGEKGEPQSKTNEFCLNCLRTMLCLCGATSARDARDSSGNGVAGEYGKWATGPARTGAADARRRDDSSASTNFSVTMGGSHTTANGGAGVDPLGMQIQLSRLKLGPVIGRGGGGKIYKGSYSGSDVAVKELEPECMDDYRVGGGGLAEAYNTIPETFSREMNHLRLLRHPHIIQLFGCAVAHSNDTGGFRYLLVMELASCSLREVLRDRLEMDESVTNHTAITSKSLISGSSHSAAVTPVSIAAGGGASVGGTPTGMDPQSLGLMRDTSSAAASASHLASSFGPQMELGEARAYLLARQICAGCAYIHDNNMIHFDIKPANILLDFAGNAKICDLGIAKLNSGPNKKIDMTASAFGGTPPYMAPELLRGDHVVSPTVDVYAFGIVLWQLFHNQPSHPVSWTVARLFNEVMANDYRPPIDTENLPPRLVELMEACWHKDMDMRPSFHELVRHLDLIRVGGDENEEDNDKDGFDEGCGILKSYEMGEKVMCWVRAKQGFKAGKVVGTNMSSNTVDVEFDDTELGVSRFVHPSDLLNIDQFESSQVEHGRLDEYAKTMGGTTITGLALQNMLLRDKRSRVEAMNYGAPLPDDIIGEGNGVRGGGGVTSSSDPVRAGLGLPSLALQVMQGGARADGVEPVAAAGLPSLPHFSLRFVRNTNVLGNTSLNMTHHNNLPGGVNVTHASVNLDRDLTYRFDGQGLQLRDYKITNAGTNLMSGTTAAVASAATGDGDGIVDKSMLWESSLVAIRDIGRGQSGSVKVAVYLPTLTLVAVKQIRFTERSSRHQMVRELRVLWTNVKPIDGTTTASEEEKQSQQRRNDGRTWHRTAPTLPAHDEVDSSDSNSNASTDGHDDARKVAFKEIFSSLDEGDEEEEKEGMRSRLQTTLVPSRFSSCSSVSFNGAHASSLHEMDVPDDKPQPQEPLHENGESVDEEEVEGAALSTCPQLVAMYDAFLDTTSQSVNLVLEYLDGGSLQDALNTLNATAVDLPPVIAATTAPIIESGTDGAGVGSGSGSGVESGKEQQQQQEEEQGEQDGAKSRVKQSLVPRGLGEKVLCNIARDVLLGLRCLHARHMVHLDIKPSNILLSFKGAAKLADFGLAKQLEEAGGFMASTFVGTAKYMSPERLRGEDYSYSSDIWSLGLSIMTCALGRFPVDSRGPCGGEITEDVNGVSTTTNVKPSFAYWSLLEQLETKKGILSLRTHDPTGVLSSEFGDFLDCCLYNKASERANVEELLAHPWIAKFATPLDTQRSEDDESNGAGSGHVASREQLEYSRALLDAIAVRVVDRVSTSKESRKMLTSTPLDYLDAQQMTLDLDPDAAMVLPVDIAKLEAFAAQLNLPLHVVRRSFDDAVRARSNALLRQRHLTRQRDEQMRMASGNASSAGGTSRRTTPTPHGSMSSSDSPGSGGGGGGYATGDSGRVRTSGSGKNAAASVPGINSSPRKNSPLLKVLGNAVRKSANARASGLLHRSSSKTPRPDTASSGSSRTKSVPESVSENYAMVLESPPVFGLDAGTPHIGMRSVTESGLCLNVGGISPMSEVSGVYTSRTSSPAAEISALSHDSVVLDVNGNNFAEDQLFP